MKCNSCSEEVSSKFAHAIATNVCPFCGETIMDVNLQLVLNGLREVMTESVKQEFIPQTFDWLKSNFNLISVESDEYQQLIHNNEQLKNELEELKSRGGKGSAPLKKNIKPEFVVDEEGNQLQVNGTPIQPDVITSGFAERAGIKQTNQDKFKEMINKMKKNAMSSDDSLPVGPPTSFSDMMNLPMEQLEKMEMAQVGGMSGPMSAIDQGFDDGSIDPIMNQFLNYGGGVKVPGQGQDMTGWNHKDAETLRRMSERVEQNQHGGVEFKFKK
jgi:hypothetical protein